MYLAFFGSVVTFTSYYWLLKRVNIVILSLIAFITPVIALFAGWIFYSEELGLRQLSGSAIVLLSLIAANTGNIIKYYKTDKVLIQGK
jgi:drug/metabolite transporter (DMT)-like permease